MSRGVTMARGPHAARPGKPPRKNGASSRSTTRKSGSGRTRSAKGSSGKRSSGDRSSGNRSSGRRGVAKPQRSRTLLLWTALVLALAGGMVFLVFYSAAFVVKDLTVSGGREEVQASAEELALIPHGRPLARVSESRVAERVLADPRIAAVSLERDWPSGVRLHITERDPVVALRGGGETWLADAGGNVFEQVDQPSRRLPLITVQGTAPSELSPSTVSGLAELWRLRPDPADLEGQLGAPKVDRHGAVTMTLDQVTLEWGPVVENQKKWQVVESLIGQDTIDPQGVAPITIDVRNPDAPVVAGLPEKLG